MPSTLAKPLEVEHVVGQGLLHRGGQLHRARPLGTGERWNLVVWLRASQPCATASALCAAASLTWWTTRASVMASPARSPPQWMCVP